MLTSSCNHVTEGRKFYETVAEGSNARLRGLCGCNPATHLNVFMKIPCTEVRNFFQIHLAMEPFCNESILRNHY